MTEDQIKHMVDRFLMWRLPENFAPDCGIHFDADAAKKLNPQNRRYEPVGTNLLDVTQATAMVRYLLQGLPNPTSSVLEEIGQERSRQITVEGWTPSHDDQHDCFELSLAAACYCQTPAERDNGTTDGTIGRDAPDLWPWADHWWKPRDNRRDLIRAAALIIAEIERLDRAQVSCCPGCGACPGFTGVDCDETCEWATTGGGCGAP